MVPLVNYHTHCLYCDGIGRPAEYVQSALEKGFSVLGFSSHAPLPFYADWVMEEKNLPVYLAEIQNLKQTNEDRLQICLGLEIDYVPGISDPSRFADLPLDYTIGSVHYTLGDIPDQYFTVDGPEDEFDDNLYKNFSGDAKRLVLTYYAHLRELIDSCTFDILGHLDVVKKNNPGECHFSESEPWYRDEVESVLESVKGNGCIVEVNTGGIARGTVSEVYPSPWIIKRCREKDIPVQVNADAHEPDQVDCAYTYAADVLSDCGYREVRILIDGEWREVGI